MPAHSFLLPKGMSRDGVIASACKYFAGLAADKPWRITVEQATSKRSTQQCRYLNGVAYKILSDATGYERDDISQFLCGLYFGEREKKVPKSHNFPNGVEMVPCRTTTTDENGKRDVLKWDAFSDYVAFVQRFAAERGIFIPDPDPNYKDSEGEE